VYEWPLSEHYGIYTSICVERRIQEAFEQWYVSGTFDSLLSYSRLMEIELIKTCYYYKENQNSTTWPCSRLTIRHHLWRPSEPYTVAWPAILAKFYVQSAMTDPALRSAYAMPRWSGACTLSEWYCLFNIGGTVYRFGTIHIPRLRHLSCLGPAGTSFPLLSPWFKLTKPTEFSPAKFQGGGLLKVIPY